MDGLAAEMSDLSAESSRAAKEKHDLNGEKRDLSMLMLERHSLIAETAISAQEKLGLSVEMPNVLAT